MKTIIALAVSSFLLTSGATPSVALTETDKALGAGSYMHVTGPENGVWNNSSERTR